MSNKSIPWKFIEADGYSSWLWLTPHFEATIWSDGHKYIYSVLDTSRGKQYPVLDGFGVSFAEATSFILEFVGKAYPLKFGYRAYAGSHATTFRINTAELIDFGPLEGTRVSVEVKDRQGHRHTKTGMLQIENFNIKVITDAGLSTKIPPAFILSVESDNRTNGSKRIGSGRTVKGNNLSGCSGKPGFVHGTIEHGPTTPFCPIHQI